MCHHGNFLTDESISLIIAGASAVYRKLIKQNLGRFRSLHFCKHYVHFTAVASATEVREAYEQVPQRRIRPKNNKL